MSRSKTLITVLALFLPAIAPATRTPAKAFMGNVETTLASLAPTPDPVRCGVHPRDVHPRDVHIDGQPASGPSRFGAFTYSSNNCADHSAGSHLDGRSTLDVGGRDARVGTSGGGSGLPLPPRVGAIVPLSETLTTLTTLTGGTMAFGGAVGSSASVGTTTVDANDTYTSRPETERTVIMVPEPSTGVLLAAGLIGLGLAAHRRNRTAGARVIQRDARC